MHQEPLGGTASNVSGWLLIPNAGPWRADLATSPHLEPQRRALFGSKRHDDIRTLLFRSESRSESIRDAYFVDVSGRPRHLYRIALSILDELLESSKTLPESLVASAAAVQHQPIYLVCTHSSYDVCCALDGRKTARLIGSLVSDRSFECTHLGGCRFAASVLLLPNGFYFGQVNGSAVNDLVTSIESGQLPLSYYRGDSGLPLVAQAAEIALRKELGVVDLNPSELVAVATDEDRDLQRVTLTVGGVTRTVEVGSTRVGEKRLMQCQGMTYGRPKQFNVFSIGEDDEYDHAGG